MNEEFIKLSAVLQQLKMSRHAWVAGVKAGRLPEPIVLGPRSRRYRRSDIEALIASLSSKGGA